MDILSKVPGDIGSRTEILRGRFFTGLHDAYVRNAIRHHYDGKLPYGDLIVVARRAEMEKTKPTSRAAKTQGVAADNTDSKKEDKLDQLMKQMKKFEEQIKQLQNNNRPQSSATNRNSQRQGQQKDKPTQRTNKCFYCQEPGHMVRECPKIPKQGN